jgi:exonuclease III
MSCHDGLVLLVSADRQEENMRFLAAVGERLAGWDADGWHAVLTGDLDVAHRVET